MALTPEQEEAGARLLSKHARAIGSSSSSTTGVSVPEPAAPGSASSEAILHGSRRALHHGPFFSTMALTLPALPPELQAEVAAGEAS